VDRVSEQGGKMVTEQIDVLMIRRSQPQQDREVRTELWWNGEAAGLMRLPFAAWIKFNRLLQKGIELDSREGKPLKVKVQVEGAQFDEIRVALPYSRAVVPVTRLAPQREVFAAPEADRAERAERADDEELIVAQRADDREEQLAEVRRATEAKLVRSLKPESGEEDG
jgi:hypothetical protein